VSLTDEENQSYMMAPESKSIRGFIEALNIFAKYMEKGFYEQYFCGAEHDELHIYVETDTLPKDSPDGRRLIALGFHVNNDCWAYFT
jgi:hypothetical protein